MTTVIQQPTVVSSTSLSATISIVFGSNVTAGNHIVVMTRVAQAANASTLDPTISDTQTNTYSSTPDVQTGALTTDDAGWDVFIASVGSSAACTVTATWSGSVQRREIHAFEVSGLSGNVRNTNTNSGTSTSPTTGTVSATIDDFMLGMIQTDYNYGTLTDDASWTAIAEGAIWNKASLQYRIAPSTTTFSATASNSASREYQAAIIAYEAAASVSAALTGTATATIDEDDIVTGGKTIILTLTGDTWVTAGATFDAQRQNIINGLDSAQAEATGWDAEVKAKEVVTAVVRTSNTVVTITLSAAAAYDITAQETITATIPASALTTSASPVVATPTFTVDPVAAGLNFMWRRRWN